LLFALISAAVIGTGNSRAADLIWTNSSSSGIWQDPTAWVTNGTDGTGNFPTNSDGAWFTNAATYSVTLSNNVSILSNSFRNASNTTATVTFNLDTNTFTTAIGSNSFVIARVAGSTSIVYVASSTQAQGGLIANGSLVVGRNGVGILYITNGYVALGASSDPGVRLGDGTNSCGTLVISGSNTYLNDSRQLSVGSPDSSGNSLVVSNSASITIGSSFRMGSSSDGGSSNNTFILDSGARATISQGHSTIGKRYGTVGSYNNTMIVENGAVCTFGGSFFIGWDSSTSSGDTGPGPATNNVLMVRNGGSVTGPGLAINGSNMLSVANASIQSGSITCSGTINLSAGVIQAGATITCSGTIQGYGSITVPVNRFCTISSGGFFKPFNSLGQLTISGGTLSLASGSTTTVQLGTNFNTTAVTGNLVLNGTLNITNSGGFTNGTYTLFTYTGTLDTNGLMIGTTPDPNLTYSVDAQTSGQVNLVAAFPPVASFTASPTSGEAPLDVTFTDISVGTITNWIWDFGDAITTNTITTGVSHTYAAGTYTVSLIIDAYGGSSTNIQADYIIVTNPPPPVAGFSGTPTSGVIPLAVAFTDTSTGNITNRFWDFGDGNTSNTTAASVSYTYTAAGTYTVSLIVSGYGGSSTNTQSSYITALNPAQLVVNPVSVDFGPVTIGQTNSLDFSVINTGDATLSGTATSTAPFVVTSGTSYNVAGGQTQIVMVAFVPESAATFNDSVVFASNGGNSTNAVSGVGLTPGSITVTPVAHDFGTLVTGTTAQVGFVVTNSGGTAVSNGTATVTGGPFSIVSGAGFSVPGFGTANVTVEFAPVSAGAFTNSVVFATANGGHATNTVTGAAAIVPVASFTASPTNGTAPLTVTLADSSEGTVTDRFWNFGDGDTTNTTATGMDHSYSTGGTYTVSLRVSGPVGTNTQTRVDYVVVLNPAHLVVNPGSLDFGSVTIGQTNSLSFSVLNAGDIPLTGTATSPAPFAITSGNSYNVAGGQTQTVTVAFAPDSTATFNGWIVFTSDGGNSINAVSGSGLTPGSISVTPAAYDFGTLVTGTTAQVGFVVTNSGGTAISNGTATVTGGPFSIVSDASFSVPGFGSTNVTVQFAPLTATAFTDSVVFATANGGDATNTVRGTGAVVPVASFSATPTNGPWPLAITFTDNSTGTITNRLWNFGDGNTSNTIATSLDHTYTTAATNTVSLTVSGPVGSDTMTVTDYIVVVNPAHLVVDPASLNFGSVTISQTNSLSFSVINTGDVPLSGTATSAAPFVVTSGDSYNVAGGRTQTVTVAFAPESAATFNDSVIFSSNGGDSTNAVSGSGLTPGSISVTPAAYDFGTLVTGTTAQVGFLVTNSGGTAVSNGTATVTGGPFSIVSGAGFSVPGFGSTNVTVQFAPLTADAFTNTVVFSTANGGDATNTVSGTGLTPGSVAVTPASWDFGMLATGTTAEASFVVTNSGGSAVSNGTARVTGGPFTVVSGATFSVPGFGSTNVAVQFAPVSGGAFTDSVVFATANGGGATNAVTGAAAIVPAAAFTGSPTNGPWPLVVSFTDNSSGTVTNRYWDFGDGATTNTSATSLAHTYSAAGTNTVSLTVSGPVGVNIQTRADYVVVVNPAHLAVNPESLNFAAVTIGQTNSLNFSVINTGDVPLSGTATGATPFAVTGGATYNVAGGQTGTVTIAFAPGSTATFNGLVLFTSDGGNSINAVTGIGLTPGSIAVTPASWDFGMLVTGTTAQANFVVTNSGGTTVSNGVATATGGPFTIASGASFSVPGFGSTNVTVQFAPVSADAFTNSMVFATANGGEATNLVTGAAAIVPVASFTGNPTNGPWPLAVSFTDNSGGTITNRFWDFGDGVTTNTTATSLAHTYSGAGTNTVSLTASGPVGTSILVLTNYIVVINPPHLVVSPASLNFGSVTIGQTNSLNFSVVNTGDVALSGTATGSAPFIVTSGASCNVAGGQTQTVTIAFAPEAAATVNDSVIFTSNGGDSTNAVHGVGLTPGSIAVTPASWDFGMLVTGATAQVSFVVTNSGGTAVSNGTATVTGVPFTIASGASFSVPGFGATSVTVQFAPVGAGAFTDRVSFATANGGEATNLVTGAAAIVPVANFTGAPTNGTAPLAVSLTDSSSGTITDRSWDFGDGVTTNTTATSLEHTYGAGTNTVSLTVSGPVGTSTLIRTNYIVAGVPPVVDFGASPTNGLTPLTVDFADASTGEITNRLWSFGDGGTSDATNTSHTYTNAGTYSVGLSIAGPYGTDTKTQTNLITVYAASATWTNANPSGHWSDGTSWDPVTVPDFGSSVIFATAGTTATVDTIDRIVNTVTFNRSENFFVDASGGAGLTISNGIAVATNFTYTISSPIVLAAANTWSVTNGGTLLISGTVSGSNSITKTGSGTMILTGTNTYGGGTIVSAGTLLVNNTGGGGTGPGAVSAAPGTTLGGHGILEGPVAITDGGVFSPGGGVGTLTISNNLTFSNASVLQYELGTNSDLTVVSGNLMLDGVLNITDAGGFTNGTYTLFTYGGTLMTNGSAGILAIGAVPDTNMIYTVDINSSGLVKLVVVIPPPVADFGGGPTNGLAPLTVMFTNTSSGWVTDSFWDFGDGATSNTPAASVGHTYSAGGNNTVQLIVTGPGGVSTNARAGYVVVAPPCNYPLSGTDASFGALGGSDTVAVTPYTNVCPWTASSNDAWIQIDGGGVNATGGAVVAYAVLPNTATRDSRVGTMTVAGQTFTVTQAGDTNSPTVVLVSPTAGVVSNAITVSATASDDVAVVQVEFYRDGGVLLGAETTPPYSMSFDTAMVSDGSHCFYAEARDAAGNVSSSATNCLTVDNNAPSVPTGLDAAAIATNQIQLCWTASYDGGSGVAGYRVFRDGAQIATTAATNHLDSGLATGTEHCYTVGAYDNVGRASAPSASACARSFVTPGSLLGTYNGLAIQTNAPSNASSGSLRLAIAKTGSFAAALVMGGGKATFKGRFDDSGNATNTVVRKGLSPLLVILHLDLSYGTDQVTGTVSDGVFTSELLADRMVYSRANPCPLAGSYTLVLVPPEGGGPEFPQGYGHATLTVAPTGGGKLSGVLGDGTKIKGNTPVSKHGTWPLYNVLYKKQGACIGWVAFGTNDTLEATVDWFRPSQSGSAYYPAGFTTNVTLIGEKYLSPPADAPSSAGDREITLDGGNLTTSIVETVAVDSVGNVLVLSPNNEKLTMTLQLKTGQFNGRFIHPSLNEMIGFAGVILQKSNAGAGHFFGTNESGAVIFEPIP